jgi:hypothetical protein
MRRVADRVHALAVAESEGGLARATTADAGTADADSAAITTGASGAARATDAGDATGAT